MESAVQMAGRVLAGRYQLSRKLGAGAFGEVWLCSDVVTRGDIVVKLLHPQWARDPAMVERFRREAQASQRIQHPSACRVFDFAVTEDDIPFITMEYLGGGTLKAELVRSGALPLPRVATWMVPVCGAVSVAHTAGIVHRDLKPENIMMRHEAGGAETPVVLDFGIAKLLDADQKLTQTGSILGSPAYMSPEQARGQSDIGPAADVYSMAIIVYELCHGQPPFVSPSFAEMAVKHAHDPAPPLEGVPPVLAQVVARCLAKEPAVRPPIAELARAISVAATAAPAGGRASLPAGPRSQGSVPVAVADSHSAPTVISTGKKAEELLAKTRAARPPAPAPPEKLGPLMIASAVVALAIVGVLVGWLLR